MVPSPYQKRVPLRKDVAKIAGVNANSLFLYAVYRMTNDKGTLQRETTIRISNERETTSFFNMNFWTCFLEMIKVNTFLGGPRVDFQQIPLYQVGEPC